MERLKEALDREYCDPWLIDGGLMVTVIARLWSGKDIPPPRLFGEASRVQGASTMSRPFSQQVTKHKDLLVS